MSVIPSCSLATTSRFMSPNREIQTLTMSSDVQTPPLRKRAESTVPIPSSPAQTSSSSEEGELTPTTERESLAAQISLDLQNGYRDVMQKDARYFTLSDVVCSHCGTKGHLSYDCPEEAEEARCFLCGATGHSSRDCPQDACFHCRQTGHRARDCPEKGQKRKQFITRRVGPPRNIELDCYICAQKGHLDCSIEKMTSGVLSCYNCGMKGHAGMGCTVPPAERILPIVMEMDRERRATKKRKKDETEEEQLKASMAFRETFLEKARQKRYKRANQGG